MKKFRVNRLFRKTRFFFFVLFGLMVLSVSLLTVVSVSRELSDEYESNSRAIANNIADSSVDILLNRNLATLQSLIDQFVQVPSIRYIYITSDTGEYLAHTFVPGIPDEILASDPFATETVQRSLSGLGDFLEVGSPILSGAAGTVHVGMDLELLGLKIQRAIGQQLALLGVVFVVGSFLTFWFVSLAARPLADLLAFAVRVAGGEEVREDESIATRDDEAGELARLFMHVAQQRSRQRESGSE